MQKPKESLLERQRLIAYLIIPATMRKAIKRVNPIQTPAIPKKEGA